ncbi:MAG: prolipoprotein diacylglyceryl transferase [Chloroflexi bacterium]|nr:prolipoprotein diacylglyceryl transferase [Chloroflexota bacterium]
MLPIPDPYMFKDLLGFINIRWYGVIIVGAALAGAWLASKEAARKGENPNHAWDALFICLIVGLVGARLYHVLSSPANSAVNFQFYMENPWITVSLLGFQFQFPRVLAIWEGGLGIYGGVLGGVLGLLGYLKWRKLNLLKWLDIGAVGLLLGQGIGRWGNFFNQELYGFPTSAAWGIPIDTDHRLPQFAFLSPLTFFHPTFLYESILCLLGALFLVAAARRYHSRLLSGEIANLYLIVYPAIRLFTEIQRPDAWLYNGVPVAQIVSASILVLAVVVLWYRRVVLKQKPSAMDAEPAAEEPEGPQAPIRRKGRVLDPRESKSRS